MFKSLRNFALFAGLNLIAASVSAQSYNIGSEIKAVQAMETSRANHASYASQLQTQLVVRCETLTKAIDEQNALRSELAQQCADAGTQIDAAKLESLKQRDLFAAENVKLAARSAVLTRIMKNRGRILKATNRELNEEIAAKRVEVLSASRSQDALRVKNSQILAQGQKLLDACINGRLLSYEELQQCYEAPAYVALLVQQSGIGDQIGVLETSILSLKGEVSILQATRAEKVSARAAKIDARIAKVKSDISALQSSANALKSAYSEAKKDVKEAQDAYKDLDRSNGLSSCRRTGQISAPEVCS